MSAIKGKPHQLTPKRIAQIQQWRTLGAQARRGRHIAQRAEFHRKRAKRPSAAKQLTKATAWGLQKMVVPVGIGGPIVALAKNRVPGYNQFQILKASGHKAGSPKQSVARRRSPRR
jgi:hypothetical protein